MPAVRQVHPDEGVARIEEREEHRGVRLRAGVRLDVGMIGTEELLRAIDGELFDAIYELASAVVALAGQPLSVLVRERGAHCLQYRRRHEVLARDQLESLALPLRLQLDQPSDLRIGFAQRAARRAA